MNNFLLATVEAIIIAIYFQEHPKTQAYFGFALIMLGVVLAQKSSTQRMAPRPSEGWRSAKRASSFKLKVQADRESCGYFVGFTVIP